jgi:hypothetical protein
MRVIFTANLIHSNMTCTGVFTSKIVEMDFLPSVGMEVESKGLGAGSRKILDVTVNIDGDDRYDAYINVADVICPTEKEFDETVQQLVTNGWEIQGKSNCE